MYEIIELKLAKYEADLKRYNEHLRDCKDRNLVKIWSRRIDIKEEVIAELYDVLNEAIIQGKTPMSARRVFKAE